jgi:tetratricopeptide (TPR) repeat protein
VRRSIAVLSMKNLSGREEDAWLSTALAEAISGELATGGQLRLIPGDNIAVMQETLSPPPGVGLNRRQLNEIGGTLGCELILSGNYHLANGRLRIEARLDDIGSAAPIASVSAEEDEHKLLDLAAGAGRELRAGLGMSPPLLGQSEAQRARFSSNPGALQFFFLGLHALRSHDATRSRELLTQAIAEDQDFALAHSMLSSTYRILGFDQRAQEEAKRALDLSSQLAREDQLLIQGAYYEVTGDWSKAIEKYQALWNFFPDNIAYGVRLVYQLMKGGQLDEAGRVIVQIRALPPPADIDPGVDLIAAVLAARRGDFADALAEASAMATHAAARKANNQLATARALQGDAALHLGDMDQARRYYADARQIYERIGASGGVAGIMNRDAGVLISRDQLDEAGKLLNAADEIATRIKYQALAAEIRFTRSDLTRQQGRMAIARAEADAAIAEARASGNQSYAARGLNLQGHVLELEGDYRGARASFESSSEIARRIGEKAVFTEAVNGLAGIDLAQGRVADARRQLEEIIPIDRKTGDKNALALRLANLSAALGMQGELGEAVKLRTEACAIHESLAAKRALAGCRLRLAQLWLADGRQADARMLIVRIASERGAAPMPPIDLARLADLYLNIGDAKNAAAAIAEARRGLDGRAAIPEQTIAIAITSARIDAESGRMADARRELVRAKSEAERLGLLPLALEARLAAAERGAGADARTEAAEIERDAAQAGLSLIAGRARAITRPRPVPASDSITRR